MTNLITIHELTKRVYPNNELYRSKLAGYLIASKQIDAKEYCNNDEYGGKKLYFFKDANHRYTAIWGDKIITLFEDNLSNMLLEVDEYIGNCL